jgi:hypothetical protein
MQLITAVVLLTSVSHVPQSAWETSMKLFKDRVEFGLAGAASVSGVAVSSRLRHSSNKTLNRDQRERELTASAARVFGWEPLSVLLEGWRRGDRAVGHSHHVDGLELNARLTYRSGPLTFSPEGWWVREKTTVSKGPGRSDTNHGGGGTMEVSWVAGPGGHGDWVGKVEAETREETSRRACAGEYGIQGTLAGWMGRLRASAEAESRRYPLAGGENERRVVRQGTGRVEGERELSEGCRLAAAVTLSGSKGSYDVRPEGGYEKSVATWWVRVRRGSEETLLGELTLEQTMGRDRYQRPLNDRRNESRRAGFRTGFRAGGLRIDATGALNLNQQFFEHPLNPDDRDQATGTFKLTTATRLWSGLEAIAILGYRDTRLVYPEADRSASSTRRRLYELRPGITWNGVAGMRVEGSVAFRADYNLFRFRDQSSTLSRGTTARAAVYAPVGDVSLLTLTVRASDDDEGGYRDGRYSIGSEAREVEVTSALSQWRPAGVAAEPRWAFRRRWSRGWGLGDFTERRAGIKLAGGPTLLDAEHVWRDPGDDYWSVSAGLEKAW